MKVTYWPLVERFSASSDLDEKLVTIWLAFADTPRCVLLGTSSDPTRFPDAVNSLSVIGEVTPKLASMEALLKTYGYAPLVTAVPQGSAEEPPQPGGSCVVPATMFVSFW